MHCNWCLSRCTFPSHKRQRRGWWPYQNTHWGPVSACHLESCPIAILNIIDRYVISISYTKIVSRNFNSDHAHEHGEKNCHWTMFHNWYSLEFGTIVCCRCKDTNKSWNMQIKNNNNYKDSCRFNINRKNKKGDLFGHPSFHFFAHSPFHFFAHSPFHF